VSSDDNVAREANVIVISEGAGLDSPPLYR